MDFISLFSVFNTTCFFCLQEKEQKLNVHLEYLSYLIHMAVFGILGVRFQFSYSSSSDDNN